MAPRSELRGYKMLNCIGTGAESIIYCARDLASGEIVAVKDVQVDEREKYKYLRHVRNEYRTLRWFHSQLDGSEPPGVVTAYRLIRSGRWRRRKRHALVMQYVEGHDLRREHRYPIGQIVDILSQVATAVARLHARGIVHGDLKPENVVVSPAGKATLVDFGFSCKAGSVAASIRGTRDYMAPEQVKMGHITEKTDIYNFGATMYFLVTKRHVPALIPALGDSSHFIVSRYAEPPSPHSLNPSVPPRMDRLILRCLRQEAIERPSCMDEVLTTLHEVRSAFVD